MDRRRSLSQSTNSRKQILTVTRAVEAAMAGWGCQEHQCCHDIRQEDYIDASIENPGSLS